MDDRYFSTVPSIPVSELVHVMPTFQGHKLLIWEILEKPMTNAQIRKALPDIPYDSIRRCLSEMKRDGFLYKDTRNERRGMASRRKWSRSEKYQ